MIIQLPNGETAEFPDTMKLEKIEGVLQKQFPAISSGDVTAQSLGQFQQENLLPSLGTLKEQAPIMGSMVTAPFKTSPIMAPIAGMGASGAALIAGHGGEPTGPTDIPDVMGASLNQFNAPLGPFALGFAGEGGGQVALKGLQKAASPFAKYFDKTITENAAAKTAQDLVNQDIPISPDLIAPSRTSKRINWLLENLWPANSIMANKRKQIYDAATTMKNEFATEYGVGKTTAELRDQAFNSFTETAGDTMFPMTRTIEAINDHIDKPFAIIGKPAEFWQGPAKTFVEMGENINAQAIRDLVNAATKGSKSMDKTARNKVMSAVNADLANYDKEAGTNFLSIYKKAGETNKLWKRIYPIENLLQRSIVDSSDELGVSLFSPARFIRLWDSQRARMISRSALQDSDIAMVDAFADKLKVMLPDLQRAKNFKGMQELPYLSGQGLSHALGTPAGAIGATVATGGAYLLPMGAEAGLAYSIMNPSGLFRKWLTTGLKPPTLIGKEVPKLGIMEATQ